ncbi:MAG: LmbE family protein, partial [Planctomycetota bacterium]|nr:LmbE family protein [Planctomycetota bacterium]
TVYHAQPYSHQDPLGNLIYPQYYVDVADVQQRKQHMLALHVSQKQWLDESQGLDSYLKTMSDLDEKLGAMSGRYSHAEGWRKHLHLGFCNRDDDPLRTALSGSIFQA